MGMLAVAQGDRGVGIVVRSLASDSATTLQHPKSKVQVGGKEPQLSRSVHLESQRSEPQNQGKKRSVKDKRILS